MLVIAALEPFFASSNRVASRYTNRFKRLDTRPDAMPAIKHAIAIMINKVVLIDYLSL